MTTCIRLTLSTTQANYNTFAKAIRRIQDSKFCTSNLNDGPTIGVLTDKGTYLWATNFTHNKATQIYYDLAIEGDAMMVRDALVILGQDFTKWTLEEIYNR